MGRYGDLQPVSWDRTNSQERGGALVAESCLRSAGQDGGHPLAVLGELGPPDRVNAPPDGPQTPAGQPVLDGLGAEPELEQLTARNDPVLAIYQCPERSAASLSDLVPDRGPNRSARRDSPPGGAQSVHQS